MQEVNYGKDIRDFIVSNFLFGDGALLEDETSFLSSGIVDSTGILELLAFVEEKYGIDIPDEERVPNNLDSVNRLSRFITKTLAERNGATNGQANGIAKGELGLNVS